MMKRHALLVAAFTGLALTPGCAPGGPPAPIDGPPLDPLPIDSSSVEVALFLVGDAGHGFEGRSPLMRHVALQVDRWAAKIPADSSVMVVFLGDNVYEVGVRDEDHPEFPTDIDHLASEVEVVRSETALDKGARAVFLPGNHDWGNRTGPEGVQRLRNQDRQLERYRAEGIAVELVPSPGRPGPEAITVQNVRLLTFDTHWWLQEESEPAKDSVMEALSARLAEPWDGYTAVVAHHPLHSAGEHGGEVSPMDWLGLQFLANRSGALVQDLSSPPYREFIARMEGVFDEVGPPLLYAAGHDHTLQVFHPTLPSGSTYAHLVSGGGSNWGPVGEADGLAWAAGTSGYMQVLIERSGRVSLRVYVFDPELLLCPPTDDPGHAECMREGVDAVQIGYRARLREGG